ncbi:hypothetical protein COB64_04160 [Candidatus Wolfebacteria bacterium]|nr:MAG: hypothetical protein COB64_04160 [Candidatus Wolfebacteria bacterium]
MKKQVFIGCYGNKKLNELFNYEPSFPVVYVHRFIHFFLEKSDIVYYVFTEKYALSEIILQVTNILDTKDSIILIIDMKHRKNVENILKSIYKKDIAVVDSNAYTDKEVLEKGWAYLVLHGSCNFGSNTLSKIKGSRLIGFFWNADDSLKNLFKIFQNRRKREEIKLTAKKFTITDATKKIAQKIVNVVLN